MGQEMWTVPSVRQERGENLTFISTNKVATFWENSRAAGKPNKCGSKLRGTVNGKTRKPQLTSRDGRGPTCNLNDRAVLNN